MNKADFSYALPSELIAQHPPENRGQSRLLVLPEKTDSPSDWHDSSITQLEQWLRPGDLLVLNDTRVIPARLFGRKESGGKVEVFLERISGARSIHAHVRSNKTLKPGQAIVLENGYVLTLEQRLGELFELVLSQGESLTALFEQQGHMPLPPYIKRPDNEIDQQRYQTVYANSPGAVAAPTAGLHFSKQQLVDLQQSGITLAQVTLHVGSGTFAPVRVEDIRLHKMHKERYRLSQTCCDSILQTRAKGGRVIAVGTTVVRTLESVVRQHGELTAGEGETDIFIYPGYEFQIVDGLLTNFHLPESTLMMLVCAFGGHDRIMQAYQHAVQQQYRFFSYGDAMLVFKA